MEILKVQNLCKTYGKGEAKVDALKNVSFSLEKGEFAAVVGESGSGKSTLLNCIGALDIPDGWAKSFFYEGGRTHHFQTAEYRIHFSILPACFRAECGAEYHISAASGLSQT